MVQSLIPLWEEEYKRTRTQEAIKSLNSTKPIPRDTLELFRCGLEYDKAFSEILSEHHPYITHKEIAPEMKMKFAECIKTFSDIDRAIRFVPHTWASCSGEPLRHPRGDDRNVGLSCSEGVEDATMYVTNYESQELESTSQKISSFAIKEEDSMGLITSGHIIWICTLRHKDFLPSDFGLEINTQYKSHSKSRCLDGVSDYHLLFFSEEKLLLINLSNITSSCDPDILMRWEIQSNSLGYLAERAANLGISLLKNMSRTPSHESDLRSRHSVKTEAGNPDVSPPDTLAADAIIQDTIIDDEWGQTHASGIHVGGRIVLNIWQLMRSEVKLNIYTAEAVAEEVLRQKVPSIPCRILYKWFLSGLGRARYRCIEYVAGRAQLNIQIMNQLDMVGTYTKLSCYLSRKPAALQPAMERLPLVMEPESGFYADPVVVLDFQSLYPSMIIGYNLCFSTCLGKVTPSRETVLGVSCCAPDQKILMDLKQEILITPNGVMSVPDKVRKGVLPRLLEEILSTRIMIKKAMKKLSTSQQVLQRILSH